jgi:hypothetical protein
MRAVGSPESFGMILMRFALNGPGCLPLVTIRCTE